MHWSGMERCPSRSAGVEQALRKLKKPTGGEKNDSGKGGGKGGKQKDSKKDTNGGKDGLE